MHCLLGLQCGGCYGHSCQVSVKRVALLSVYRALLRVYRALLSVYGTLLGLRCGGCYGHAYQLSVNRALLCTCRALWRVHRVLLSVYRAPSYVGLDILMCDISLCMPTNRCTSIELYTYIHFECIQGSFECM